MTKWHLEEGVEEEEMGVPKKIDEHLLDFQNFLAQAGEARAYALNYTNPIRQFIRFASQKIIFYPHEVSRALVSEFQLALYKERGHKVETVGAYLYRIKRFFKFISDNKGEIITDISILPRPKSKEGRLKRYYTFEDLLKRYLAVQRKWLSYAYANQTSKHLKMFFLYLRTQGIKNVYAVTEGHIISYREFLWNELKEGRSSSLVVESQVDRLRIINKFFNFLYRERIISKIPTFEIDWTAYYKKMRQEAKSLSKPIRYKEWAPPGIKDLIGKFMDYEQAKGKARSTIIGYKKSLKIFFNFLDKKGVTSVDQVTKRVLLDYYTYLLTFKGARGNGTACSTRAALLFGVKVFFRFLARFDFIQKDPTHDIEAIKEERRLPRDYMDAGETVKVLAKPNINTPLGLRDRALLETLFSTGIRKTELCYLDLNDVDCHEGMLRVNHPKGGMNYQRVIPVGEVAVRYIKLYIEKGRPRLENSHHTPALFLSYSGNRIDKEAPLSIVKKYCFKAGIRKNITVHSFRVSCATLMLKNNAGLRYVQEQLGHRRITSTQIYTRLCPIDLKTEHRRCHPRETYASEGTL